MILAREVYRSDNSSGAPICGKDTVLSDALIARLENMDVQTVYVEGNLCGDEGGRSLEDMLAELDRRFSKVRSNPLSEILHDIYSDYLKRSMGDGGGR